MIDKGSYDSGNAIDYEEWLNRIVPSDDEECRSPEMFGYYIDKKNIAKRFASKAKTVVEIGVRAGYSAHAFLSAIKNVRSYTGFDLFEEYTGWRRGNENVQMILKRDFPQVFVRLVSGDTTKMSLLELNGVDLFHIDGDHSFNGCLHDMEIAWPTVSEGGILVVDDYDYLYDVRSAVDRFIADKEKEISSIEYVKTYRGDMVLTKRVGIKKMMDYHITYPNPGILGGDTVCFLSVCREFGKRTGSRVFVDLAQDVAEAYRDDTFRFGNKGWWFPAHSDELYFVKESEGYKNELGLFYASMGLLTDEVPRLDLPTFDAQEPRAIIQPFSMSAQNPPIEYVQGIADTFCEFTGAELYVVGLPETPRTIKHVRYDLLTRGISNVMRIVANSSFVLTPRSMTAHLAAGYRKPSFVWLPPDSFNWHLNYPDWDSEKCLFDDGLDSAKLKLASILNRTWNWTK